MAAVIYALCALTCLASAWLLLRAHRRSGHRLLFWSGLCFLGLFANNLLVFLDRMVLTEVDLSTPRLFVALGALLLLLFGLIWEGE